MSGKSRVLLVGCGGVGTVAALNLERGGRAEVSGVLRSNYNLVKETGYTIHSCDHGELKGWRPTEESSDRPFDYIVCCTKNIPDTSPTLPEIISPAVSAGHTTIVLMQNGLHIERPFIERFPENIILSGVSRVDAHEVSKGVIEQKQRDLLHIGAFQHPSLSRDTLEKKAKQFIAIYSASGKTTCLYKPEVEYERWTKLVYNASFNPVCALTGLNTGELQLNENTNTHTLAGLVIPAMKEVVEIARAAGHILPEDIVDDAIRSNPVEQMITPSMQVDVQKVGS
ncbi:2-dehydropantoate 2-reductase [Penicillium alfredii]|uniref:2-dehydropantoate 2-reductase n=1 Tax=Penicillium alfredii TaxID=1506179 RepID=A0A9W9GA34_9EURO|nr:2-dehydropantoate 2-reductase [Penicillium alfredii]KAJ5114777.1 2-dehydropantoate 2-reductase [Penicillium alfredii]